MRQVRRMTFETNSSSTHSLTICPEETYNKWLDGKVLFSDWKEDFIEVEELTPGDYEEAGIKYEACKRKYYKSWNELSAEEKKEYTTEYVQSIIRLLVEIILQLLAIMDMTNRYESL